MYKKKLFLSLMSMPLSFYMFNSMDYHKSRASEKRNEIAKRQNMLNEKVLSFTSQEVLNQLSQNTNIYEFNKKWGYRPVELSGQFDFSKAVYVKAVKSGNFGYEVLVPFNFYTENQEGEGSWLWVSRGFIDEKSYGQENLYHHTGNGFSTVKGVLTMPHLNQSDVTNDYVNVSSMVQSDIDHIDLHEFSVLKGLKPNSDLNTSSSNKKLFSDRFYLKEVSFDNNNSTTFPLVESVSNLSNFRLSPQNHEYVNKVYSGAAFMIIFGNMWFWVCA